MERSMLAIMAIVFIVGLVGFITTLPSSDPTITSAMESPTGNAVFSPEQCGHCTGTVTCAAKGSTARNYPNACAAVCDNAKVLLDAPCERIPAVHP